MSSSHVTALLILGIGLAILALLVRARFGEKYELKAIDLALVVVPLLFVLLISGKIQGLDLFGVKVDISKAFADAVDKNIESQVVAISSPPVQDVVRMLNMSAKGGIRDIPKLVEEKTEALEFRLSHGGYNGPAIQKYFDALYASSYLQYLIVLNENGSLFGIYNVLDLAVNFRINGDQAYLNLARWLNKADKTARHNLTRLPGFIGADQAVSGELSKRDVLNRMDSLQLDSLPVVDQDGRFMGTVEKSQLTTSLILEVADRLGDKAGKAE